MIKQKWFSILLAGLLFASTFSITGSTLQAQGTSHTFPETGKTVQGLFLDYWNNHGGLAQQGYPISNEFQEGSDTDGKLYTVQYFERAVFEAHPDNNPPYNVELSLLGTASYKAKYGSAGAPAQHTSTDNPRLFNATGFTIGGVFRNYWENHGGLTQQGYPISEEFQEVSSTDGKPYTVQYFERAVFEYHPEQTNPDYKVLLSLLGSLYFKAKYGDGSGVGTTPTPTTMPAPTATAMPAPNNAGQVLLYNMDSGTGSTGHVDASGNYESYKNQTVSNFGAGWSQIVALGGGRLLFYNINTGLSRVGQIDSAGKYSDISSNSTLGLGWTHLASAGNGIILYQKNTTSMGGTARVNADGSITFLKAYNNFGTGWTHIVGLDNGVLLFYQRGTSTAATLHSDSDGNITRLQVFNNWTTIWDHLVPSTNGLVLQYYSIDGRAVVSRIDANGAETVLTRHPEAGGNPPLPAPFPTVAGLSNGTLLFLNGSNGSAVTGRLGGDGSVTIYNRYPAGSFSNWANAIAIR